MNFNKIISLGRRNKTVTIYDNGANGQFLNVGGGFYYIGQTNFGPESLKSIITNGDDWDIRLYPIDKIKNIINFEDIDSFENQVELIPKMGIDTDSKKIIAAETKTGAVILIDNELLKPVIDNKNTYSFYIRQSKKFNYLAVKKGLVLEAVILPIMVNERFFKEFDWFIDIVKRTQIYSKAEDILEALKEMDLDVEDFEDNEKDEILELEGQEEIKE